MVDFVNVTVVAAVAGFLLYELGWLSNAVTLSVAAAYWCLFLLPTAYAAVTVLHPGFGLIDYSVYGSLDHVISRVVGRALTEGRPPGERGFWLSVGVVAVLVCWCIPRSAAICGALAFAYDFYFYKTDAPELCFAGDLCRALLYVARCPWPAVVATLATAVVTLAIPCWIIAARIPVMSFCALFLYVLCSATGCAKEWFSYGKLGDDGSAATVILLTGCAAASWWTPHVSLTFAVVFTGYDVIFVPVTAAGEVEAQHILAKDLRRMYREHAKPRLENMFGLENMQNIGEGAVAAAVGVPFVAAYVAIIALGGESAPVTSDAGTELASSWSGVTLPPVGRWGEVAYDWVRWGGRCIYFVAGSLGYFSKIAVTLTDRVRPGQRRLAMALAAGALVPYALLCYYKVEIVVVAGWAELVRLELKRREEEVFTLPSLFWFSLALAPSTIAGAVTTELWHDVDPAASLAERFITAYLGMSWVDWILGNDWLRLAERLVKMAYGASIVFKRLAPAAAPPTYRVAFAALAYLMFFEMWLYVAGRPCRVPVLYALGGTKFMASPLADRLWNSEESADEFELSDDMSALLRRLGLAERVGPVFAREQIDENALPFLTVEDLVEAGVADEDARKVVSVAAVPDAEPENTAAEEPAPAAEDAPAPESKQIPERLCCPISLELMVRPVIAADGHTYDRSSIEDWLARGNTTSPTTGAPLEHLHLADNHLVRSMVSEYQDSLASR